jgi:hypothetical protein
MQRPPRNLFKPDSKFHLRTPSRSAVVSAVYLCQRKGIRITTIGPKKPLALRHEILAGLLLQINRDIL